MPYKVKIAKQAEEQILSWDLPADVVEKLCHQLFRELPKDPAAMLREVVVPHANYRSCPITVDSREFPYRFWFVFVVDCGTPNELHIISGRHAIDTERN